MCFHDDHHQQLGVNHTLRHPQREELATVVASLKSWSGVRNAKTPAGLGQALRGWSGL
jgi:hypothetical protein